MPLRLLLGLTALLFLSACGGLPPYHYQYVAGRTAVLQGDYAMPPPSAPPAVLMAIAAGNRIAGLPYQYGAGHGREISASYDCSGAASFVLRSAGLLADSMPSSGFRHYGESGEGRWISVYARHDHTFLVVAGLRFDTGWSGRASRGPAWTDHDRPTTGAVVRHPEGY